jgi:WD40 repeat protein
VSNDDEVHGFGAHLANRERRKEAKQQQAAQQAAQQQAAAQQAAARKHDINRTVRFGGAIGYQRWLSAAWSLDGSQVAVGGHSLDAKHGELEIWNGRTGQHEGHGTRHLRHDLAGHVVSLSWAPNNTHLAAIEDDPKSGLQAVNIRSQAEGKRAISVPAGPRLTQVAWSPDGSQIALSARDARPVLLVDSGSGQLRRSLEGVSGPVAWEPGGHRIAAPDGPNVAIFDAASGQRERTITGQEHQATALAWATRGTVLAVSDGEHIRVIDADSGERQWNLPWGTSEYDRSDDPTVRYIGWLDRGRYLIEFRKHDAWSTDEAGTRIGTISLWDVTAHSLFRFHFHETLNDRQRPPAEVLLAPQGGRQALICYDDHTPAIWEISGDLPGYEP